MVIEGSIPVLGTAIVNAPHWLYRLYDSIDYPVDHFVVFNNNGRDQITEEIDSLKEERHPFIKKLHICHLPGNLGCAGAWNMIIKSFLNSPWWLISNHDVAYCPGFLKAVYEKMLDAKTGLVHGCRGSWDVFAIKDWVVHKYGLFDENLYPGYCEDSDYGMRFAHDDLKREMSVGVDYYHGNKIDSYDDGSQTWRSEPGLEGRIHRAHQMNRQYMHAKWGPNWHSDVEGMPYKTPFNRDFPQFFTTFDLGFVRDKHLGF